MRYEHQPTAGSWLRAGGFDWSDADQYVGDDSNGERETGELPSGGPLWRFARVAEVISAPSAPSRPWVLGSADRVVKAYDLRAFDGTARMRALAEAEAARALSDISGVVTTYRTGTVGDWLIIEMERLGPSIADHVAAVRAGDAAPRGRRRWGVLLEDAAATLYAIHRRGLLHRDVKPANLMFDSLQSRLVVGDFSIASTRATRLRRRAAGADDPSLGTTRFIAPEQFEGRIGPAVDQYAFGVTATDALDGDDTPAARAVIARATAVDPEDRYPSVAEFGAALRAALDDTAPRRASSRLERVAPK